MSRKREREEESKIKEPRKKPKKQNDAKGTKEQAALPIAALSPLFEIPELVENILKYLIMKPATILSIATASLRHNAIVHSKSFWMRLGFTDRLSYTDAIAPSVLRRLLIELRAQHLRKKTAVVKKNQKNTESIVYALALSCEDSTLLGEKDLDSFLVQRTFTDDAYLTLKNILKLSKLSNYITMEEFLEMILIPEAEIQQDLQSVDYVQNYTIMKYPPLEPEEFKGYYPLLHVRDHIIYEIENSIHKKFIDKYQFVVFLIDSRSIYKQICFISINHETNTIECCGDLILSALDPYNWDANYIYDYLDEDVLYNISYFLSKFVFKLDEIDDNLAKKELAKMQASRLYANERSCLLSVSRAVPKYYWENIPLYQNKNCSW